MRHFAPLKDLAPSPRAFLRAPPQGETHEKPLPWFIGFPGFGTFAGTVWGENTYEKQQWVVFLEWHWHIWKLGKSRTIKWLIPWFYNGFCAIFTTSVDKRSLHPRSAQNLRGNLKLSPSAFKPPKPYWLGIMVRRRGWCSFAKQDALNDSNPIMECKSTASPRATTEKKTLLNNMSDAMMCLSFSANLPLQKSVILSRRFLQHEGLR